MWNEIKKLCLHSLTMGWSYILGTIGVTLDSLDLIAVVVNDPSLTETVSNAFGGNPQIVGRILLGVTVVNIITRLRSLRKTNVSDQ